MVYLSLSIDDFSPVQYSIPPLIRTPLLPNNSVLIREVSFGKREHHMHSQYLLPRICVLSRVVSSLESPLRKGPLYCLAVVPIP